MRDYILVMITLSFLFVSCKDKKQTSEKKEILLETADRPTEIEFQNKAHELVFEMVETVGNYSKLRELKDVVYTYTYTTPDNRSDVSTEKYIFDGELSYGNFEQHERTFPQLDGNMEQGFDGTEFWLKHKGVIVEDSMLHKRVVFGRKTNFYWFTMLQKLMDDGLIYEFVKQDTIDNKQYDVVKVSFTSKENKLTDIYQIYINQETKLVDQFLFTVADFGKMTPFLMKLEYEEIQGILIPTKRKYKGSNWAAEITDKPWVSVDWSGIKFDNGLTQKDFQ